MYGQTVAPLIANDTFTLIACANGPVQPGNVGVNRCEVIDITNLGENSGFIKACGTINKNNVAAVLLKSFSNTGTTATFRIVNLSSTATLKISILLIGQVSQSILIPPKSTSEIINAPNIKTITAKIECTNRLGVLDETAMGLFQWIK